MPELSEREIIDVLEKWRVEGIKSRLSGAPCPYLEGTIAHYMHLVGWYDKDKAISTAFRRKLRESLTEKLSQRVPRTIAGKDYDIPGRLGE